MQNGKGAKRIDKYANVSTEGIKKDTPAQKVLIKCLSQIHLIK